MLKLFIMYFVLGFLFVIASFVSDFIIKRSEEKCHMLKKNK